MDIEILIWVIMEWFTQAGGSFWSSLDLITVRCINHITQFSPVWTPSYPDMCAKWSESTCIKSAVSDWIKLAACMCVCVCVWVGGWVCAYVCVPVFAITSSKYINGGGVQLTMAIIKGLWTSLGICKPLPLKMGHCGVDLLNSQHTDE